ncbi:MAG TPA: diguanylate cyclase, partial [Planctomycetota bacterium]|nr:diguanylate cyclase [Planctomycetota bacterium]
ACETASDALNRAARSAEHDPLTGLPNRVLLIDRISTAIASAKRRGTRIGVLFLDLDGFKHVNDTLGHAVGDEVLKLVAHRLSCTVREADTASRIGGDEFLILLPDITSGADADRVAAKVIAALAAPTRLGDHVLRLGSSIGVSLYPDDGDDANTLMDRADAAMYLAKRHAAGALDAPGERSPTPAISHPTALASLRSPLSRLELARAEEEAHRTRLREANEQLVLAVLGERELAAAAKQAQARQTSFLAMLAHELRNPLAPLSSAAAMLGSDSPHAPPVAALRAVIERQVGQLSRLVTDLLDMSRVNTGKLRLELGTIELIGIIDAAVAACRPAMDTRLQSFRIHLPASPLRLTGDGVRLTQVLVNLLDNASRYTPEGGEIELSVELQDERVTTTISDNGIGILPEMLPQIFDLFVQDARAVTFRAAGLGLGLAVVRELIRAHGGEVTASSEGAGRGSRFVVTLPRLAEPTEGH